MRAAAAVATWTVVLLLTLLGVSVAIAGGLLVWLAWARDDIGLLDCSRASAARHRC